MSTRGLKPGDRVRVTALRRLQGFQPGDKGAVVSGPHALPAGDGDYYIVGMETPAPWNAAVVFLADEIEPDV